ncbi:ABC transporter ATP-binding protein [Arcanobacterium pinnipediorum]|uniref:ABC transporter ATP-binding protein n=1 Tax=Arcanobacterium pinnipediorum TaxID=1503041 RepID=A0ABY5AGS1_9ACTO|nr:ABC transporter ATP-binding protein [Arcanobacterium pinnipediorum]USR78911.1 ABC transporter ATP-binding protein [Arcanobacterium pinnipediorum]
MITVSNLTKDYGSQKGVFDVSLAVQPGSVYGYLGPNGAGKSTTIRHLMGFIKADSGTVRIAQHDCWTEQKKIQQLTGYLPGEIAFPQAMSGLAYLKLTARLRAMKDTTRMNELLEMFELNPRAPLKRMSKGMKQKIAIVAAFMHQPDYYLLDEPTSGLDPLMQDRFVELIAQEKQRGATILLSSHIFAEVEKTCDFVGLVRGGRLITEVPIEDFRGNKQSTYSIVFATRGDCARFRQDFPEAQTQARKATVTLSSGRLNELMHSLAQLDVVGLHENEQSLEEYFMGFYGEEA